MLKLYSFSFSLSQICNAQLFLNHHSACHSIFITLHYYKYPVKIRVKSDVASKINEPSKNWQKFWLKFGVLNYHPKYGCWISSLLQMFLKISNVWDLSFIDLVLQVNTPKFRNFSCHIYVISSLSLMCMCMPPPETEGYRKIITFFLILCVFLHNFLPHVSTFLEQVSISAVSL